MPKRKYSLKIEYIWAGLLLVAAIILVVIGIPWVMWAIFAVAAIITYLIVRNIK